MGPRRPWRRRFERHGTGKPCEGGGWRRHRGRTDSWRMHGGAAAHKHSPRGSGSPAGERRPCSTHGATLSGDTTWGWSGDGHGAGGGTPGRQGNRRDQRGWREVGASEPLFRTQCRRSCHQAPGVLRLGALCPQAPRDPREDRRGVQDSGPPPVCPWPSQQPARGSGRVLRGPRGALRTLVWKPECMCNGRDGKLVSCDCGHSVRQGARPLLP